MKINFKHLIYYFTLAIVLVSCTEDEVNYTPKVYTPSAALSVTTSNVADNSFDVNFTAQGDGVLYYAIQLSNAAAPSASDIILKSSSSIVNGEANLTSGTAWTYTMSKEVYGSYDYSIYSVMTSVDGIASAVSKTDVTTPDTAAPAFLRDSSDPAFTTAGVSPFAPITFTFDEPVFYQGGDIKFTAFAGGAGGREIIVNSASALSMSGASITVNTHGTFAPDDFIIVTWADGTFKDKAGKNVPALTGFSHYFSTREFTAPEAAALMVGTYNYETVFYGSFLGGFYTRNAALFLPDMGQFELKLDPSDASGTTLLGINVFSPLIGFGFPRTPENLKIKFGASGELAILDMDQTSGIPANVDIKWRHYVSGITPVPGFYDVEAGTINHYLSALVDNGSDFIIDDIDYNYTRIGTFARSTPELQEDLKERNEFLKNKAEKNKTYKNSNYKTIKLIK